MKYFSMLIKPASSTCNLRCKYCFYDDVATQRRIKNYGVMDENTISNLLDRVFEQFDDEAVINFAFQGGEPTCAGLAYFKNFVRLVNARKKDFHNINYSIQTNGTLINEDWICFFKENKFLVGISLDGFEMNHDLNRLDELGNRTFKKVMNTICLCRENKVEYNILTVLTKELSHHPIELFEFYKNEKFDYVQLIPCLGKLSGINDEFSLSPVDFEKFMTPFFKKWKSEYMIGFQMHVTLFDNLISMFAGYPPQQCGYLGFCSLQFVVEANGDVYPCDFYVLDQYCIGNFNKNTIIEMVKNQHAQQFLSEPRKYCSLCSTCRYQNICHGQCRRMNGVYFSENFCGYQKFIFNNEKDLVEITQFILKGKP